jgi:hypothetical protein
LRFIEPHLEGILAARTQVGDATLA